MSVNIYFKNHYMLIDKYIFVIPSACLSWEVLGTWASKRGPTPPSILKLDIFSSCFCKKGCFLSFEWWKCNFATFGPCKNVFDPPLENPLLALPWKKSKSSTHVKGTCSCIEIPKRYMARESLGTPAMVHRRTSEKD